MNTVPYVMNTEKLGQLASANPTAAAVFAAMASRQRHRTEATVLARFRHAIENKGVKLDKVHFNALIKALAKMRLGRITRTRAGRPITFKWIISMQEIGQAAQKAALKHPAVTPLAIVKEEPVKAPVVPRGMKIVVIINGEVKEKELTESQFKALIS